MLLYQETLQNCRRVMLLYPMIFTLLSAALLSWAILRARRLLRSQSPGSLRRLARGLAVLGCAILVLVGCARLRRGLFLPFEREDQQITVTGLVTELHPDLLAPRLEPVEEGLVCVGCTVTVDGRDYYCLISDGIGPGDRVSITFLPVSHVILSCRILPRTY